MLEETLVVPSITRGISRAPAASISSSDSMSESQSQCGIITISTAQYPLYSTYRQCVDRLESALRRLWTSLPSVGEHPRRWRRPCIPSPHGETCGELDHPCQPPSGDDRGETVTESSRVSRVQLLDHIRLSGCRQYAETSLDRNVGQ